MDTRIIGFQKLLAELEASLPVLERNLADSEQKAARVIDAMRVEVAETKALIVDTRSRIERLAVVSAPSLEERGLAANSSSEASDTLNMSDQIRTLAAKILHGAERPLKRATLVKELARRGLVLSKLTELDLLTKALKRDKAFVNIRGRGYWLADRELPAA